MPTPRRSRLVWTLALLGAVGLVASMAVLTLRAPAPPPIAAKAACEVAAEVRVRALPSADSPPVLAHAKSPARLFVDGEPFFSSPEAPRRLSVGEHLVEVRGPGEDELLTTRIRIDPFTPALLHAERTEDVGLTLVRLGAACASCASPIVELRLDPEPSSDATFEVLRAAAFSLRNDRWTMAAAQLRKVPARRRSHPSYLRLAAGVHRAAGDDASARKVVRALGRQDASSKSQLQALEALEKTEQARRAQVPLERWNRLTTRFGKLAGRFERQASGSVLATTKRLEVLTASFTRSLREEDLRGQEEVVLAVEETLTALVRELRAVAPEDCAFQLEVVATALRDEA